MSAAQLWPSCAFDRFVCVSDHDDSLLHHITFPAAVYLSTWSPSLCTACKTFVRGGMAGLCNLTLQCVITGNVLLLPLLRRWMKKGNGPEGKLSGLSCSYLCQRPDEMHWMKTQLQYFSLICKNLRVCSYSHNWEINMSVIIIIYCVRGVGESRVWAVVHRILHIMLSCSLFFFPKMIKQTERESDFMWTAGEL